MSNNEKKVFDIDNSNSGGWNSTNNAFKVKNEIKTDENQGGWGKNDSNNEEQSQGVNW